MSVTGTSFKPKPVESFVVDCVNENEKAQQNGNKISSGGPKFKSATPCAKMRTKSILTVILFILGLSCVLAYISNRYFEETRHCQTTQCKRAEKHLLDSINFSVNPCDNFYEFACGNWKKLHPIPSDTFSVDLFQSIETRTAKEIAKFLKQEDSNREPKAVHQARALFRSCIRGGAINESDVFQDIALILENISLPIVPSFTDRSENFSWVLTTVLGKKLILQNYYIEFTITNDPKNHTVKRISIIKPTTTTPLSTNRVLEQRRRVHSEDECYGYLYENATQYLLEKEDLHDDEQYRYIKDVVSRVYAENGDEWTEEVEDDFNELMVLFAKFDQEVNDLLDVYYDKSPMIPEYVTIDELQELSDFISECNNINPIIDWKTFLEWMFEDVAEVELDFEDRDQEILILNKEYLIAIFKLLASTPPYVIEFHMWWRTVFGIIPFTTSILNAHHDKYIYEVTGNEKRPRDEYCAEIANGILGFAVAFFITDDPAVKKNIAKITEMVDNIQQAFLDEIKDLKWMDEETRRKALQKLQALGKKIGYPEWMDNPSEYNEYYEGVFMDENDFFNNVLRENRRQFYWLLENYHVLDTEEDDGWASNPLDVNAFNNIDENDIIIPAGIFPFPFYNLGLESLNYGAIGVVVGHELTHGFDNTGKEYDNDGHLNPWWTNETREEYAKRATCFVDHYDQFNFTGVQDADNETTLNGNQTLDENIADNGGLRIAFYAYQEFVAKNGEEKRLAAFKKYTNEQLFFLAFANTWCEHGTSKSLRLSLMDEHSPNVVRVQETLKNSEEFANTWKCPVGSPMNPDEHKCQIW